jgi:hypothetical protein
MKEQGHLRMLKDPFGLGYICRHPPSLGQSQLGRRQSRIPRLLRTLRLAELNLQCTGGCGRDLWCRSGCQWE